MVTDGEIPQPSEQILERLRGAHEELGLEVGAAVLPCVGLGFLGLVRRLPGLQADAAGWRPRPALPTPRFSYPSFGPPAPLATGARSAGWGPRDAAHGGAVHALARVQELVGGGRPQRRPLLRQQRGQTRQDAASTSIPPCVHMQPSALLCICYISRHRSHRCTSLPFLQRGGGGRLDPCLWHVRRCMLRCRLGWSVGSAMRPRVTPMPPCWWNSRLSCQPGSRAPAGGRRVPCKGRGRRSRRPRRRRPQPGRLPGWAGLLGSPICPAASLSTEHRGMQPRACSAGRPQHRKLAPPGRAAHPTQSHTPFALLTRGAAHPAREAHGPEPHAWS